MQCTVAQNMRRYGEEARGDGLFTKRSGGKSENVVPEASIVDSARIDKPCSPARSGRTVSAVPCIYFAGAR